MTLANPSSELHDSYLIELSALKTAIAATQHYLAVAHRRRARLMAELELRSEPARAESAPAITPYPRPEVNRCRRGYDYRGTTFRCREKKDIWIGLMQRLLDDFPEKHADIVEALRAKGRKRCYLSRDRQALYENKEMGWVVSHSVRLENGWFLDKNLSGEKMLELLHAAVQAAGLTWTDDVTVRLNSIRM